MSINKDLIKKINETFKESDFAVTDLSHSRSIIEIEGKNAKEVLKKGCPFNFNSFSKNSCTNSIYNGISFSADMLKKILIKSDLSLYEVLVNLFIIP